MKPTTRHGQTLLKIGQVLLIVTAIVRITHCLDGDFSFALMLFGVVFVVAALKGRHQQPATGNQAYPQDPAAPR